MLNPVNDYSIDCTGDVACGDEIIFTEGVFVYRGHHTKPKFLGSRTVQAKVIKESYGKKKQQHTFTLIITGGEGFDPIRLGEKICRKGRVIYRNKTYRKPWPSEAMRNIAIGEKHVRGDQARADRELRFFDTDGT